jgi:sulfur relay (sulfurtransferase) complex TusBCD TusD component (DsrE family)
MTNENNIVLVFKTDGMGISETQPLKEQLAKTFLTLTAQMEPLLKVICLYTDGVKLACEGSPVLEELTTLEQRGVRIVLCQTCLNTFGLSDQVQLGIIGGMGDIITAMWQADKVIMV